MKLTKWETEQLVLKVKSAIDWLGDVASDPRNGELCIGLASCAVGLEKALGKKPNEKLNKMLTRPINKDFERQINASKKPDMWVRPNARQKPYAGGE